MSVLTSVFGRRKGIQKRFNNLTQIVRSHSPPSPASFSSPGLDKAFDPYNLYAASQSSVNQALPLPPDAPPLRGSSPKVLLDFTPDNMSEWFPSELLQAQNETPRRPERNASLGVTHRRDMSGSSQRGPFMATLGMSRIAEDHDPRKESFASEDDVIVIEAPRGRDPTRSPLAASFKQDAQNTQPREGSVATTRRPLPAPLKIPDPPEARLRRTASVDQLPTAIAESALHRAHSLARSRHASLTRSRSRRSKSRPSSVYSCYSDTDIDNLSAVSGATLARALVASYIMSPASASVTSPPSSSYARARGHLARQDSAILPRGELPFLYNRKSIRSSKGSLASSGTPNTYWRDRRISGDQIVIVSPEERSVWGGDHLVPPVPPMPEGLSPERSARSTKSSPSRSRSRGNSSNVGGGKYSGVPPQKQDDNQTVSDIPSSDDGPDRKRRRTSIMPDAASSTQAAAAIAQGHLFAEDVSTAATQPNSSSTGSSSSHYTSSSQSDGHNATSVTTVGSAHSKVQSPGSAASTPALTSIASSPANSSSSRAPATPSSGTGVHSPIFRSFSDSSNAPRSTFAPGAGSPLLPIGERPRSSIPISPTQHNLSPGEHQSHRPYSMMSPLQPPQMPAARSQDSPESPDLLDIMFMGSRVPVQRPNGLSGTRVLSPPAPISVPPRPSPISSTFEFIPDQEGSPSASAVRQTFPETPYAFTPLVSAGFATPALPSGAFPPLPRAASTAIRSGKYPPSVMGKRALMRSATLVSPNPPQLSGRTPVTPPASGSGALFEISEGISGQPPLSAGVLSAIEEGSTPATPLSMPSSYSNTPEPSPDLRRSMRPGSLNLSSDSSPPSRPPSIVLPMKRSLTRSPSPVPSAYAVPLPPSPMPSVYSTKSRDDSFSTPLDSPSIVRSRSSPGPQKSQSTPSPSSSRFRDLPIAPSKSLDSQKSVETTPSKRLARTRPPPPSGPRKPSNPAVAAAILGRSRNGSVSSVGGPSTVTAYAHPAAWNLSASGPRFQTTPINFRGLTMEAAQWTLTSQQLQDVVSTAIKQSADASFIRLLPGEMLHEQVPAEIARLEALSADLRTNYKVGVRKRKMLLATLKATAEGGELAEQVAAARIVEEVAELSDSLDRISEELYHTTDQLAQLTHLRDVHSTSALAMALRKLNSSFIKHLAEKETLRQQVAALEQQRDDAWRFAQEAAQELDDFTDKMSVVSDAPTPAQSRRSSKVNIARKASLRKAGLRSPSRRGHVSRASIASRSSATGVSPVVRHSMHFDNLPPVPPIPTRTPLGILTSGLPTRSSGQGSETPTSEMRAMVQAQEELCQMLGINPDELRVPMPSARLKRAASMSVMESPKPESRASLARSNSDMLTPRSHKSSTWKYHYRSRSIDDRTAMLAAIGMSSA